MRVTKRDGTLENITFDKILLRVKKLGESRKLGVPYSALVMKVIDQLYDGIPTSKIDELTAEQCATLSTQHYDYGVLIQKYSYITLQNLGCDITSFLC